MRYIIIMLFVSCTNEQSKNINPDIEAAVESYISYNESLNDKGVQFNIEYEILKKYHQKDSTIIEDLQLYRTLLNKYHKVQVRLDSIYDENSIENI